MPSLHNSGASQALAVNHRHLRGRGAPEPPGRTWVGRRRGGKVETREGACAPEGQLGRVFHSEGPASTECISGEGETLGRAEDSRGTWSVSPIPTWVPGSLLRSQT